MIFTFIVLVDIAGSYLYKRISATSARPTIRMGPPERMFIRADGQVKPIENKKPAPKLKQLRISSYQLMLRAAFLLLNIVTDFTLLSVVKNLEDCD